MTKQQQQWINEIILAGRVSVRLTTHGKVPIPGMRPFWAVIDHTSGTGLRMRSVDVIMPVTVNVEGAMLHDEPEFYMPIDRVIPCVVGQTLKLELNLAGAFK